MPRTVPRSTTACRPGSSAGRGPQDDLHAPILRAAFGAGIGRYRIGGTVGEHAHASRREVGRGLLLQRLDALARALGISLDQLLRDPPRHRTCEETLKEQLQQRAALFANLPVTLRTLIQ